MIFLLILTPQSIRLAAFCQLPGRGAFLLLTKSCPRVRGKWHEVPKGVRLKTAECRELFPLSFAYAQQLPRKRWRLFDNSKKA